MILFSIIFIYLNLFVYYRFGFVDQREVIWDCKGIAIRCFRTFGWCNFGCCSYLNSLTIFSRSRLSQSYSVIWRLVLLQNFLSHQYSIHFIGVYPLKANFRKNLTYIHNVHQYYFWPLSSVPWTISYAWLKTDSPNQYSLQIHPYSHIISKPFLLNLFSWLACFVSACLMPSQLTLPTFISWGSVFLGLVWGKCFCFSCSVLPLHCFCLAIFIRRILGLVSVRLMLSDNGLKSLKYWKNSLYLGKDFFARSEKKHFENLLW